MAISVAWQTTATITAVTSTALYTTPTTGNFGNANTRDLVICNAGTVNAYVSASPSATSAATVTGFLIPAGGTAILTQCQVPATTIIFGMATLACPVSIGFATNVAYI